MSRYLVSIPAWVHVWVEASSEDAATDEDTLSDAVLEEHGKYPELDFRDLGYDQATILDTESDVEIR